MGVPSVEMMWGQYPDGEKSAVAAVVGGDVGKHIKEDDWDTCCIRVSRCLNYAGSPVTGWSKMLNPYMDKGSHVRASKGGDEKWYIYSTYDFRVYLTNTFGQPRRFGGDASSSSVSGLKGIIMFGFVHVDLWNGSEVRHLEFFGDSRIKSENVLVWPSAT